MKQIQVAETLGITQSAISKYFKNIRGTTIPIEHVPEVQTLIGQMANILVLPSTLPSQQLELMHLFCQACTQVRHKGLMCPLCQQNMKVKIEDCTFCQKEGCDNSSTLKLY
jgi:predicted transcriptional regulator